MARRDDGVLCAVARAVFVMPNNGISIDPRRYASVVLIHKARPRRRSRTTRARAHAPRWKRRYGSKALLSSVHVKDRKKRKPKKPNVLAPLPRVRRMSKGVHFGIAFVGLLFASLLAYTIWQYASAAQQEKDAIERARLDAGS